MSPQRPPWPTQRHRRFPSRRRCLLRRCLVPATAVRGPAPLLPLPSAGRAPLAAGGARTGAGAGPANPAGRGRAASAYTRRISLRAPASPRLSARARLAYPQDLWHAMQTQEISGSDALLLLTQRPIVADAASTRAARRTTGVVACGPLPAAPLPVAAPPDAPLPDAPPAVALPPVAPFAEALPPVEAPPIAPIAP